MIILTSMANDDGAIDNISNHIRLSSIPLGKRQSPTLPHKLAVWDEEWNKKKHQYSYFQPPFLVNYKPSAIKLTFVFTGKPPAVTSPVQVWPNEGRGPSASNEGRGPSAK